PVVPDVESAEEMAPELARLLESPLIRALPVLPESPERPDSTDPLTFAVPLMPVLMAPAVNLASPVRPVSPELPEEAVGLPTAVELAPPVLPVFVEDDWAVGGAAWRERASGAGEALTSPRAPQLVLTAAIESP